MRLAGLVALLAAACSASGGKRAAVEVPRAQALPTPLTPLPARPAHPQQELLDAIFELWSFDDPKGTLLDFRQLRALLLGSGKSDDVALLDTQIARALALQGQRTEAQALLLSLRSESTLVMAYAMLESSRLSAQAGHSAAAQQQFGQAFRYAAAQRLDTLAVEAAWLAAGASAATPARRAWLEQARVYAERTPSPPARAWRARLWLDWGWEELRAGAPERALPSFRRSLDLAHEAGTAQALRAAEYALAHSYRRLGRCAAALELLAPLQQLHRDSSSTYGLVQEELAECLLALGNRPSAQPHFARAYALLSQDPWIAAHQPARLRRLLDFSR